jgi:glycosyltransferase involved in cell wall biosynthesis
MRVLFLSEGNAETWSCWSGTAKSIVDQLRSEGHSVTTADVGLHGLEKGLAAIATMSPNKRRWITQLNLGAAPFVLRSRKANAVVAAHQGRIDVILQIGATFKVSERFEIPYCLCCDSNISVAQRGASSGYSDGTAISPATLEAIVERERGVYQGAAAIFPLSGQLRNSFIDDFGIPADRVQTVYAGPNFHEGSVRRPVQRRPPNHPPTVLFVGLQFHRKGGDVLVESFRQVRARVPNARLLLVGVPVGYVEGAGISCLGRINKNTPEGAAALAEAYASADVFALPTRFEPFGIAYVEAMHFGLPCIGPQAWAVPEIIEDGVTGFTVPVDDVSALTDRLMRLLSDPILSRAMGNAARDRAQDLFTWPAVIEKMTGVMSGLVERRRRTAFVLC